MTEQKKENQQDEVKLWINKIDVAQKNYHEYHKLINDIRKYYRNEINKDKQNVFWSSIETLKPFLYFKQPKPYIERREKSTNKIHNMACKMLEKALIWDLEQFDFDSVIKYARNDFLLSGCGMVIERYKPFFGIIEDNEKKQIEIKINEQVNTEYLDPVNFIADSEKVGIWEDCTWFAIRQYLTFDEAISAFGTEFHHTLYNNSFEGTKSVEIFEIWDKKSQRVLYLSKSCPHKFLKVVERFSASDNFYPMPKPLLASTTNDSLIPVPDYVQIKPLLDELDGVTLRMQKTMKALKVSGCYDNSFPELASILNKEVTLVSVSDFERLKSAGGIKNIVEFMPIEQYILALQSLAQRRQDIVNAIYEITGVSDIMRGSSNGDDTATAINKKTAFGTLRNQDRQNDMQRFIAELFKIKAEYICEYFASEKLLSFLSQEEQFLPEAVAAVELLRKEHLRGMIMGIESDGIFAESERNKQNIEAITTIHNIINQAFDIVSKQPALLNLYRQMINSVVSNLANARQYESVLNNCFDKISEELNTPDKEVITPQPNLQAEAIEVQKQRNILDYQIKKEQNEIKKAELLLKKQSEEAKNILDAKKVEIQASEQN